jgi:hypothetical protein
MQQVAEVKPSGSSAIGERAFADLLPSSLLRSADVTKLRAGDVNR